MSGRTQEVRQGGVDRGSVISFVIPVKPVPVNEQYQRRANPRDGGRGLRKTDAAKLYAAAIEKAGRAATRGVAMFTGPVRVQFVVFFENERPDIDGPLKPTLDGLQGITYDNDRKVRGLHVERETEAPARVEVYVEEYRGRMLPLHAPGVPLAYEPDPGAVAAIERARERLRPKKKASEQASQPLLALVPPKKRASLLERRLVKSVRRFAP